MEHKTFSAIHTKVDEAQGIVEHIVAVMGNLDQGGDIIHNGAFTKTLGERGGKIRVLDQHQTDSVLRTLGKPISLQEIGRNELPLEVIQKYPTATGALKAITQYNLKTQAGHDAFYHVLAGDVDEYSIGYDPVKGGTDYSKVLDSDGAEMTARNLRELKLYEYSPCLWGMNPATVTLSAKSDEPTEVKPWNVFKRGGRWAVYKVDADGNPTGEALGTHDTEEEARAQLRALYASEPNAGKDAEKDVMADYPWDQCMRDQTERYGDEETARRVCGYIRAHSGASADVTLETLRAKAEGELGVKPKNSAEKDVMADYPWDECMRDQMERYGDEDTAARVCATIRQRAHGSADVTLETLRAKVEKELGIEPKKSAGSWGEPKAGREPEGVKVGRRVSAEQLRRAKEAHAALGDFIKWAEYGDQDESTAPQTDGAASDSQKSQAGPVTPPTDVNALEMEILELEIALSEV